MDELFSRIWQMFGRQRREERRVGIDFSQEPPLMSPQSAPGNSTMLLGEKLDRIGRISSLRSRERIPRSYVFALSTLLFIYLFTCGIPRLFDQIDGQYAGAAREMIARHDWLVPTQDGVPRLQKPPFVYWCEILSMHVFGITEFAARFPIALATIGWFLATGLIAWRIIGTWSASLASSLTLAMFVATFFFCHLVMPEPVICCFLTLTFLVLLIAADAPSERARQQNSDGWLLATWTLMALGTLAKGIHATIIPIAAFSLAALLRRSFRRVWCRLVLRPYGWMLFIAIVLPWYLVVESRYPGFAKDQILNEQIGSALSRRWPPDSDRVPLLIFWVEQLVLLLPISLLFPAAIAVTLQRRRFFRPWISDAGILLLAWIVVVALGISFSNIQDYYLLIAWTPVAVWIAWVVSRNAISFKWPGIVVSLLGVCGVGLASGLAVSRSAVSPDSSNTQALVGDTIMNVFQVLPATVWNKVIPLLWTISGLAIGTGVVMFLLDRKRKSHLCFSAMALLMAAFFAAGTYAMCLVEDQLSSAKVGAVIDSRAHPDSMVISDGGPNENTSLFFYVHCPIFWVNAHPDIEFATCALGIGRDTFLTHEQVRAAWNGMKQVFLITEGSDLVRWRAYLRPDETPPIIGRCGSRVILSNR
jgi:4-amino-4-deoxy-L-arabinose transferase-like glycosyltransferase